MRVVITHTDFRLYWPARLIALHKALKARGDELVVIEAARRGTNYDFCDDSLRTAPNLNWMQLFPGQSLKDLRPQAIYRALSSRLDELKPDVVVSGAIAFPTGAAAVRWCRLNRRGIVVMDDARWEDVPRSWLVNAVKKVFYRNSDAVLIPATSHTGSYAAWGVPCGKMFYGLNVIDNDWFAQRATTADRDRDRLREKRGLPCRFFLGVGRHVKKKNWTALIDSLGAQCFKTFILKLRSRLCYQIFIFKI